MWRATKNCDADGPLDHANDKSCKAKIGSESGFCECKNGQHIMKKGCGLPETYGYSYNTCEEACFEKGK